MTRAAKKCEKLMGRLKSPRQAQRFLDTHAQINIIFCARRYRMAANAYRQTRSGAFDLWHRYTLKMTT